VQVDHLVAGTQLAYGLLAQTADAQDAAERFGKRPSG
jgi:hypothetical protein